ncbi:FG-GAP-like repeat-containing protein [Umezawaea tangerina]|uniref:FG-GAP-like repeat-containing protein n=1 Tax=Umezawaea tangerina TaxID=84725 RepID=UPI000B209558|nr:FG-GAP-like repeat-containing protein [Umezawaea tangerina]
MRKTTVLVLSAALALAAGGPGPATAAPRVGGGTSDSNGGGTSDFNGDGYDDLAVGAPGSTVAGVAAAGLVAVAFGSADGLSQDRDVLSQADADVPGEATASARFGTALSAADFNGDGFDDLAVGAPADGVGGSVTVFFGGVDGLGDATAVTGTWHLGTALTAADLDGDGRPELVATETPNNFGRIRRFTVAEGATTLVPTADDSAYGLSALAAGDVDHDGDDDLVALFTQVGGSYSYAYFPGSPAGLATADRVVRTYDGGADLAVGDLDADGFADLVVGRPQEQFGQPLGGEVAVWYGTADGLGDAPGALIGQDSPGVPDAAEEYDQFGSSVAIGDTTGDGYPELAIGAQQETVGALSAAGAVTVLAGGADGFADGRWLTRGVDGVPGTAHAKDAFGWMLLFGDYDGDGHADLAATAIGENPAPGWPYYGDGSVTVVPGAGSSGAGVLTSASFGRSGSLARFGWALGR